MSDEPRSGQGDVLPENVDGRADVREDSVSADPLKLVNVPKAWRDENFVLICGNKHYLREFTMDERYLWRKLRDEGNLDGLVDDFEKLNAEVREFDTNTLADAYQKRADVIEKRIDELIERTPLDKWTTQVEDEINKLVVEKESFLTKVNELMSPKRQKLVEKSPEIMEKLEHIRETQGNVFLKMTWNLAKRECDETRSFDDYRAEAKGSDRLAAQEVVEEGNFTWEAHSLNRAARRQLLKTTTRSKS